MTVLKGSLTLISIIILLCLTISAEAASESKSYNEICARNVPTLRIGIGDRPFPPFYDKLVDGEYTEGLDIELAQRVADKLCPGKLLEVKQVLVPFEKIFSGLREDKFDLIISAVSINVPGEKRKNANYSVPYFKDSGLAVAVNAKSRLTSTFPKNVKKGLLGKTIFTQSGSSSASYLMNLKSMVRFELNTEALSVGEVFENALKTQDAVIVLDYPTLKHYMNTDEHKKLWAFAKIDGAPVILYREDYGIVVDEREENRALLYKINVILTELWLDDTLSDIRKDALDEWTSEEKILKGLENVPFLGLLTQKRMSLSIGLGYVSNKKDVDSTTLSINPKFTFHIVKDHLLNIKGLAYDVEASYSKATTELTSEETTKESFLLNFAKISYNYKEKLKFYAAAGYGANTTIKKVEAQPDETDGFASFTIGGGIEIPMPDMKWLVFTIDYKDVREANIEKGSHTTLTTGFAITMP